MYSFFPILSIESQLICQKCRLNTTAAGPSIYFLGSNKHIVYISVATNNIAYKGKQLKINLASKPLKICIFLFKTSFSPTSSTSVKC